MKTRMKFLLSLAVVSLVIAGCANLPAWLPGGGPGMTVVNCNTPVCNVTITVNGCTISDPGRLYVSHRGPTQIIWRLSTQNHDFNPNGIAFKDPGGPFSNPGHPGKGVYVWHDNNTGPAGPWRYKIDVKQDNAGSCSIDPEVVNG